MFQISKLSASSQELVTELTTSMKSRSPVTALAIARVLAYKALMPSSGVEDIVTFYRTTCQLDLEQTVNAINEIMVVDTKLVMEYCQKFYMLRYSFMCPQKAIFAFNAETAVEDFFGISRHFDRETLDLIRQNNADLMRYHAKFTSLMDELNGAPEPVAE